MSAPVILRANTASQNHPIGPFVDETDGDTPETGLTIANTDIKLIKHNATTSANKNSGGATHIVNGIYYATFDATDTNTVGNRGMISIDATGALPWSAAFIVVPELVYDLHYADGILDAPTALPVLGTDQWPEHLAWVAAVAGGLHELRQTAGLFSVYNAAGSATLGTATVSDDGTTFIREGLA